MADPRGRGFKRGTGRWHACMPAPATPTPADYGWEYVGIDHDQLPNDVPVYAQGDYQLVGSAFTWTVQNTRTGAVRHFSGAPVAEVTTAVFGERYLAAPPERTIAEFYGVAR